MYLFISKKSSDYQKILKEFKNSAEKFRGRIVYTVVNIDTKENEQLIEYFGFKKSDLPIVRITSIRNNMVKFKPANKQMTEETISSFSQDFLDKKLTHYLLTEDIPSDWNTKNLKKLVGKNFNQTARNKRKSVLVLFCD
jgi:protein disulfide-isomerase A1